MSKIKCICNYCSIEFLRYKSQIRNINKIFCCKEHLHISLKEEMKGENNPNYNNKWSDEQKIKQSNETKERYLKNPELRFEAGKANRGKKFSPELIDKMHKDRNSDSYSHEHSSETKELIGKLSKEKFTDEYKEKFRKIMEDKGHWVKLEEKTDKEIYYILSNWIEKMWNYTVDENQLLLLKENGIFNNKTNTKGVVRDHIFTRNSGFNERVFPEILQHPENCQILTHSKNISKRKDGITLNELFVKILNTSHNWKYQKKIEKLIMNYKKGYRWVNETE